MQMQIMSFTESCLRQLPPEQVHVHIRMVLYKARDCHACMACVEVSCVLWVALIVALRAGVAMW